MTLAICVQCGEEKLGAFTPCLRCGFDPVEPEDKARRLLLCDHSMSAENLRAIAKQIKAGNPPSFDEAEIEQMAQDIRDMPGLEKMPLGCAIAWYSPLVVLLAGRQRDGRGRRQRDTHL